MKKRSKPVSIYAGKPVGQKRAGLTLAKIMAVTRMLEDAERPLSDNLDPRKILRAMAKAAGIPRTFIMSQPQLAALKRQIVQDAACKLYRKHRGLSLALLKFFP